MQHSQQTPQSECGDRSPVGRRAAAAAADAAYETASRATLPLELQKAELEAKAAKDALDAAQAVFDNRQALFREGAIAQKDVNDAQVALSQARLQAESTRRQADDLKGFGHEQALKAAEESQDFGGLFLGFSFFLIAAALLLMAMLFRFGLEQRAPEIGTLLALGFEAVKQQREVYLVRSSAVFLRVTPQRRKLVVGDQASVIEQPPNQG